jgi:hypothetical protein
MVDIEEENVDGYDHWYPTIFPGKFFLNGIPYYLFQSPQVEYFNLDDGTTSLPSGFHMCSHCILAKSGFYNNSLNLDEYLDGKIFEDFSPALGPNGDNFYKNIYRRKPNTINKGLDSDILEGEYIIDTDNNVVIASGISDAILIYESQVEYSGVRLNYDIHPFNIGAFFDRFFLYIGYNDKLRTI